MKERLKGCVVAKLHALEAWIDVPEVSDAETNARVAKRTKRILAFIDRFLPEELREKA